MGRLNNAYILLTFSPCLLIIFPCVHSLPTAVRSNYKCPAGYVPHCFPIHPKFTNLYGKASRFTVSELNKLVKTEMATEQKCYSKGCSPRSDGKCFRTTACNKDGPGTCRERGCDYDLSCWGKCNPDILREDTAGTSRRECPQFCYNVSPTNCFIHKPCD